MAVFNKNQPFISVSVTNTSEVKRMLGGAVAATQLTFSRKTLEQLLLRRTKSRFELEGPNAQKDPDGTRWVELSEATKKYKKDPRILVGDGYTRGGREHRAGTLKRAITILRANMRPAVVQTNTGGGFRIGIATGTEAARYAAIHNSGTSRIPQRRFLGISDSDVESVDNFIKRNFLSYGIRTS